MKNVKELSLRPYTGRLYIASTRKAYEKAHVKLFKQPDILTCAQAGRFNGGEDKDGSWAYLIFAESAPVLAHELCHCLFHVWERLGMNPSDSGGEQFCYMLSQLMLEAKDAAS